jgi:hypothetical protein
MRLTQPTKGNEGVWFHLELMGVDEVASPAHAANHRTRNPVHFAKIS